MNIPESLTYHDYDYIMGGEETTPEQALLHDLTEQSKDECFCPNCGKEWGYDAVEMTDDSFGSVTRACWTCDGVGETE